MDRKMTLAIARAHQRHGRPLTLSVTGVSMEPVLQDSDNIIIETKDSYAIGDILVYDYELIRTSVKDYIAGEDNTHTFAKEFYQKGQYVYGINYYDVMAEMIANDAIDMRTFNVPREQKVLMLLRLDYFRKIGILDTDAQTELIADCTSVKNETEILIKSILRHEMRRTAANNPELIEMCRQVKAQDIDFMLKLKAMMVL